jgi:hypothetical protein
MDELTTVQLQEVALKTRIWQGMELEEAAAEAGLTIEQAMEILSPAMNAPRTRDQLRLREHQRLEWQHQQIMGRLKKDATDDDAHELSMKLSKEKARLLGLNAPVQVETKSDISIHISWASPDRLSYRNEQVIEAEAVPAVPWKELDPNSVAAAVAATKAKEPAAPEPPAEPVAEARSPEQTEGKGVVATSPADAPTLPPWIIELPDTPRLPKPEFINGQVWYFGDDEDGRMARAREKALEKEAREKKP